MLHALRDVLQKFAVCTCRCVRLCKHKRQCNTSTGLAVAAAAVLLLPVAVLRLWTKQFLFAHTLSKSFAIATGYGRAPHPRGTGKEKLHVCDFHLVRVYLIHPHPSYCSLGSLFVSSLFVRRKYPARGRDASMSSGRRHDGCCLTASECAQVK